LHLSESDLLKFNKSMLTLHSCHNMHSFHEAMMSGTRDLAAYEAGTVFHMEPQDVFMVDFTLEAYHKYLVNYAARGKDPIKNECLSARLTKTRTSRISDIKKKTDWDEEAYRDLMLPFGLYHTAGIDLIYNGEYTKRVNIYRQADQDDFSDRELLLLKLFSNQIDMALRKVKMQETLSASSLGAIDADEGLCLLNRLAEFVYANRYASELFQLCNGVYSRLAELSRHVIRLAKKRSLPYHYGGCLKINRRELWFEYIPCRGSDGYLNYVLVFHMTPEPFADSAKVLRLTAPQKPPH
jgi:hypothetical protein